MALDGGVVGGKSGRSRSFRSVVGKGLGDEEPEGFGVSSTGFVLRERGVRLVVRRRRLRMGVSDVDGWAFTFLTLGAGVATGVRVRGVRLVVRRRRWSRGAPDDDSAC